MKKILFVLGCLIFLGVDAQKTIDGMMNAEKSFAAYAVANGTRDAFLKYLDSSCVVFEGKKIVNGIEAWSKRGKTPGILNWHPQFGEIAGSGDFGYTSGPWTFQQSSVKDSIVATGQFNSIWRLNARGEWKNVLDIGNNLPANLNAPEQKIAVKKVSKANVSDDVILKVEHAFIDLARTDLQAAYKNFLSASSILNHNGYAPATTLAEQATVILKTAPAIEYEPAGSGIASSGDLAYVYGYTQLNGKKDNYLRVWRREKEGWRIALEVLHQ